jgi:hypothetical protein
MMGCQSGRQEHLFYSFDLESVIPQRHLLRCLDLADLRQHLAEYYCHTGREPFLVSSFSPKPPFSQTRLL